jgi:hypothetical protein
MPAPGPRSRSAATKADYAPSARPRRRNGRGGSLGTRDQLKAYAGHGDDAKGRAVVLFRQPPKLADRLVDGVVADHHPVPAARDQVVARLHLTAGVMQRHQHLHHPGLQRLQPLGRVDLPGRWPDREGAQPKVRSAGQFDALVTLGEVRSAIHRHPIGNP